MFIFNSSCGWKNWLPIILKSYHINVGVGHQWHYKKKINGTNVIKNFFTKQGFVVGSKANLITVDPSFKKLLNKKFFKNYPIKTVRIQDDLYFILPPCPYGVKSSLDPDDPVKTIDIQPNKNIGGDQSTKDGEPSPPLKKNWKDFYGHLKLGPSSDPVNKYEIIFDSQLVKIDDKILNISKDNMNNNIIRENNLNCFFNLNNTPLDQRTIKQLLYPDPSHTISSIDPQQFFVTNGIEYGSIHDSILILNFIKMAIDNLQASWVNGHLTMKESAYKKMLDPIAKINTDWFGAPSPTPSAILSYIGPQPIAHRKTQFIKEIFDTTFDFAPLSFFDSETASFLDQLTSDHWVLLNGYINFTWDTKITLKDKKTGILGLDLIIMVHVFDYGTSKQFINQDFNGILSIYGFIKCLLWRKNNWRWWLGLGLGTTINGDYQNQRLNINEKNLESFIEAIYQEKTKIQWSGLMNQWHWTNCFYNYMVGYWKFFKIIIIINPFYIIFHKMFNIYVGLGYNVSYTSYKNYQLQWTNQLVEKENSLYLNNIPMDP